MRGSCPVAHSEFLGWSVFRHSDVVGIIEDAARFSSKVSAAHPAVPNGFDPPQHDRYRSIVDHYFHADEMASLEPALRTIARDLIEAIPRDREVEFIGRFALTYALRAQRVWLDWPLFTETALREWTMRNHRAILAGDRAAMEKVGRDFDETVRRVVAEHRARAHVTDDVTSRLMREQIDGQPLTDDEIIAILRNWTVGELGTMSASVGILIDYLARHPTLQDQLRAAPEDLPEAIDEILRIHAPLLSNRRVTTEPVELGGRRIEAGQRITVFWDSANRDESVFGDPDEYRPRENAPNNVLYGRGIHFCPGAPLARLELRVALEVLLASTSRIGPATDAAPDYAAYPASGLRTLPLQIH